VTAATANNLSSLPEEVDLLITQAETLRDKVIISLFADSGMRLTELFNIKAPHVDFSANTVIIWGKGGRLVKSPFWIPPNIFADSRVELLSTKCNENRRRASRASRVQARNLR
jgi:site-specific recombinase XerC